ncbi:hypothetical protein AQ490_20675 [Wenjunlia vitaminophila]|uniref:DUF1772 domain-containing protein n=1 Tax=Wenjunlia vitaminophila TaxID=76728 RepID=A0A0T6LTI9_WENVI|nr:anthrone oxygenase family protein [Wenjunlia vitaminophila]KRV49403.1 hypothetical protein AQ490_20675 [Wenjunlia vitaminophila]
MNHPAAPTTTPPATGRRWSGAVLGLALLTTGLVAGLFFAFSCAVMPGLARVDDRTFVETMQEINVAILNPVFYTAFMGSLALCAVAAVQQRRLGRRHVLRWVLAALVLHALLFLVTSAISVPLNEELADAGAAPRDPGAVRERFETPWVAWNVVRSVLSAGALVCLGAAVQRHGRAGAGTGEPHAAVSRAVHRASVR